MNIKTTRFISFVLIMCMLLGISAEAAKVGGKTISSQGACVMDFETGEVLYEYYGNYPRVPGSMTKIMNVYCVYEAIANGEITLDTLVPISQSVYNKSRNSVYQSVLPLNYNTPYTVNELLDVVVVHSASGAAVALAELVGGGSEAAFVERMNRKAAQMGIDAYYYDSCGIAENKISPIGMATLARNIIKDYPDILTRSSKRSVYFHGSNYRTTNRLFSSYYYEGADGLKTGTTSAAGYCFCGTGVRNGRRMISVTMRSSSTGQRYIDTARLLDYGFAVAHARYNTIYFTNLRTFINGHEMPTFMYDGGSPKALIIAEDLKDYGFDVVYDQQSNMLTLTYNKDKPFSPIPMDYYRNKNGVKAFTLGDKGTIKVILNDGRESFELKDTYSINGYMCVSIDEFQGIYDYFWDCEEMSANITTYYKKPEAILPSGVKLTSESAYVMDYNSGDVLYSFNSEEKKPVASISKMMSMYVMLDALKNGEISLDTIVPISENVYKLSRIKEFKTMVNLEYDEEYTVDEMLDMIAVYSAAACVVAMAELICGDESAFVERMNDKAIQIGIDCTFNNSTGVRINPLKDKENLMSAKDVAVMTRQMIKDYPEILDRTSLVKKDFHGSEYYNQNKLISENKYPLADGFKNAMTATAGYCMCATAEKGEDRIIAVTLHSGSNETRFDDCIKMLDFGFDNKSKYEEIVMFEKSEDIKINIDGNYPMIFTGAQPMLSGGKVFVGVKELMEALGKEVIINSLDAGVTVRDEAVTVTVVPGSLLMKTAMTNLMTGEIREENVTLSAAPIICGDTVLAPINDIVEVFEASVIFDKDSQTLFIIAGVC